jgi:hypothetical protein
LRCHSHPRNHDSGYDQYDLAAEMSHIFLDLSESDDGSLTPNRDCGKVKSARDGGLSFREMIYIKSILIGILTFFLTTIVYVVCLTSYLIGKYPSPPLNLSGVLNRPSFWLIALAAFALGFYWEYRRAKDLRDRSVVHHNP